jgi:hypothetical protein
MRTTNISVDSDSLHDVAKTITTEEAGSMINDGNSFDTLLSVNAKIVPRNRRASVMSDTSHQTKVQFDNFNILRTNKKLLYWTRKLIKDDDTFISFTVMLTIVLVLIENEIFYEDGNEESILVTYIRFMVIFISITTTVWVTRRYSMTLNNEILECRYSASDSLFTTGLWKYALIELIITCICPYPFLNETFTITQMGFEMEYSWDAVLTIFCLMRFYMMSRLFFHYSKYSKVRAEYVCSLNGVKIDTTFALKSQLQESPFTTVCALFFILSIVCSVLSRIVERPDRVYTEEHIEEFDIESEDILNESKLKLFTDNLWMIIVTSTTVGYGDFYPATHLGRGIALAACIISSVYIGLLISAIQFQINHTPKQLIIYSLLTKASRKEELRRVNKQLAGLILLYQTTKSEAILSKARIKLRQNFICKGDLLDVPESDIAIARRLIDQTSDLSDFTFRISKSNFINSTLEVSKTISIFRELLSKTHDKTHGSVNVRRSIRDRILPERFHENGEMSISPDYKNSYHDPNYLETSSESDSEESRFIRLSSSEPEDNPISGFMR